MTRMLISLILVNLSLSPVIFAEQDEIAPGTLPDELPNQETEVVLAPQDDLELSQPITPLLPETINQEKSPKLKSIQAEIDAELAKPDPNYIPQVAAETNAEAQSSPPPSALKIEKPKAISEVSEKPNETTAQLAVESKMKESQSCQEIASSRRGLGCSSPNWATPKITNYVPLVLSPKVIQEINADPSHPIPYQTYILKLPLPNVSPTRPPKGVSDISIILSNNEFYPAKVILKSGTSFRLLFTTTNRNSAALVIEKLNIERWVASQPEGDKKRTERDRSKFEVNRELSFQRVTEISFDAKPGTYNFHDVITGASGEIVVEE